MCFFTFMMLCCLFRCEVSSFPLLRKFEYLMLCEGKHLLFPHNWCLGFCLYTQLAEQFNIETIFLELWNRGWETELHDSYSEL